MEDMTGSADRAANYPAFNTPQPDASASRRPEAILPDAPSNPPPANPAAVARRAPGPAVHLRLLLLIVLLGGPLLAFCILTGR